MSETLDRAALAAMFAANLRAYAHSFRSAPGADLQQGPDLLRVYLPTPSARFNTIIAKPLAGTALERCAAESMAFFAGRARAYTWVMDAAGAARKAATHEVMQRHGLVGFAEPPLMVLPLHCISQQPRPQHLQIVPVTTLTQIEQFIAVFSQGEPGQGLDPATLRPLFAPRVGSGSTVRSFLGLIGDRPVACATLVPSGGIAGIYEVATVPRRSAAGLRRGDHPPRVSIRTPSGPCGEHAPVLQRRALPLPSARLYRVRLLLDLPNPRVQPGLTWVACSKT